MDKKDVELSEKNGCQVSGAHPEDEVKVVSESVVVNIPDNVEVESQAPRAKATGAHPANEEEESVIKNVDANTQNALIDRLYVENLEDEATDRSGSAETNSRGAAGQAVHVESESQMIDNSVTGSLLNGGTTVSAAHEVRSSDGRKPYCILASVFLTWIQKLLKDLRKNHKKCIVIGLLSVILAGTLKAVGSAHGDVNDSCNASNDSSKPMELNVDGFDLMFWNDSDHLVAVYENGTFDSTFGNRCRINLDNHLVKMELPARCSGIYFLHVADYNYISAMGLCLDVRGVGFSVCGEMLLKCYGSKNNNIWQFNSKNSFYKKGLLRDPQFAEECGIKVATNGDILVDLPPKCSGIYRCEAGETQHCYEAEQESGVLKKISC